MTDLLIGPGPLTDLLIDPLTDLLIGPGPLTDLLIDPLTDLLVDLLTNLLVDLLVDLLVNLLVDLLSDSVVAFSVSWFFCEDSIGDFGGKFCEGFGGFGGSCGNGIAIVLLFISYLVSAD